MCVCAHPTTSSASALMPAPPPDRPHRFDPCVAASPKRPRPGVARATLDLPQHIIAIIYRMMHSRPPPPAPPPPPHQPPTPPRTMLDPPIHVRNACHHPPPPDANNSPHVDHVPHCEAPRALPCCHPFELSGGMCQRVVIALALACKPQLLIADEPTTGLDVTTQKAVMDLTVDLTRERGMSMILITHDLGPGCRRSHPGRGDGKRPRRRDCPEAETIFKAPSHRYTRKLCGQRHARA